MLEGLAQIDWKALDAAEIPIWLHDLASGEESRKREAISKLEERIAPLMLISGYGSYLDLLKISSNDLPYRVTPFIVELLEYEQNPSFKIGLLEIVHNLCSYNSAKHDLPVDQQENFENWSNQIRDAVRKGESLYQRLLDDSSLAVRQDATAVLNALNDHFS